MIILVVYISHTYIYIYISHIYISHHTFASVLFFSGWKSINGLKHQTVDSAHGITVDIHGPTSVRRNDLNLLRDSDINDRLCVLCLYYIFGDSAYKKRSNMTSYLKRHELPDGFERQVACFSVVSVNIIYVLQYYACLVGIMP